MIVATTILVALGLVASVAYFAHTVLAVRARWAAMTDEQRELVKRYGR